MIEWLVGWWQTLQVAATILVIVGHAARYVHRRKPDPNR